MDYAKLGERIRSYRKQLKLTQEELSEYAGISLSFLGHIERGTRRASLETIVAICNAMKISPQYLLQDSLANDIVGIPTIEVGKKKEILRQVSDLLDHYYDEE